MTPMREKFSQIFLRRLDEIETEATAHGISLRELCNSGKVWISTVYRWRAAAPKTIEQVDDLERALVALKRKKSSKKKLPQGDS